MERFSSLALFIVEKPSAEEQKGSTSMQSDAGMDEWVNMEAALCARFFPSSLRAVREKGKEEDERSCAFAVVVVGAVLLSFDSDCQRKPVSRSETEGEKKLERTRRKNTTIDLPELIQARRRHQQSYAMRPRNVSNGPASKLIPLSLCVFRSSLAIGKCAPSNAKNRF